MSKFLDAIFVFQLLLLLGTILLLAGIVAVGVGVATNQWGLAVAGAVGMAGGLGHFAAAHIGRTLLQIASSNAAILAKINRA